MKVKSDIRTPKKEMMVYKSGLLPPQSYAKIIFILEAAR